MTHISRTLLSLTLFGLVAAGEAPKPTATASSTVPGSGEVVWMEGEQARHNFNRDRFYDNVPRNDLSGGNWLCHSGDAVGQSELRFTLAKPGAYHAWIRCNLPNSSYRYAFDGGELVRLDLAGAIAPLPLASQRTLGWVHLAPVQLAAGEHLLRLIVDSALKNAGGIDCVLLTDSAWKPAGVVQPDGLVADPSTVVAASAFPPFAVTSVTVPGKGDFVWLEGESPSRHTCARHYWYDSVGRDLLFNKDWLSHYGPKPAEAEYRFAVKQSAPYTWWVRCNPDESVLSYSLDGGAPVAIDLSAPRERMGLTEGGDLRAIGWINVGKLDLTAGEPSAPAEVMHARDHDEADADQR